jgi:hypothetical protein
MSGALTVLGPGRVQHHVGQRAVLQVPYRSVPVATGQQERPDALALLTEFPEPGGKLVLRFSHASGKLLAIQKSLSSAFSGPFTQIDSIARIRSM